MILLSIITFTAVFMAVMAASALMGFTADPVEQRIQSMSKPQQKTMGTQRRNDPFKKVMAKFGQSVAPKKEKEISETKQRLQQAGLYHESAFHVYWGMRIALTVMLPLVSILLLTLFAVKLPVLWVGIFTAGFGFMAADIFLWWKKKQRHEQIFRGLPDALDLLVVCLEAGLGLDAALQKVSEEFHISNPVLSGELKMTCTSIRLGQARNEALHDFGERTNVMDVKTLVAVLVQADRFGTSSAEALRVHAQDMRTRRRQRAEEMAAKTTVKLIFPLVVFIFPSIFVVLGGPAAIRIMEVFINK
jgi:tight adherence protein C